jgi:hypothetical protein
MKYIAMLVLAVGLATAASAQFSRDDHYRVDVWHDRGYRADHLTIDQINRAYDQKVRQVQDDYTITPRLKRKLTHEINEERKYRLKAARKYERKERRKWFPNRDND